MDSLIIKSVIRLSVRSLGCSFARASAWSFVCVSGCSVVSVVPPFAQFFLLFMGINML